MPHTGLGLGITTDFPIRYDSDTQGPKSIRFPIRYDSISIFQLQYQFCFDNGRDSQRTNAVNCTRNPLTWCIIKKYECFTLGIHPKAVKKYKYTFNFIFVMAIWPTNNQKCTVMYRPEHNTVGNVLQVVQPLVSSQHQSD